MIKNSKKSNSEKLELKSLPYSFIPFPKGGKYHYVYNDKDLPKHNVVEGCSGYIDYKITPETSLAMDYREIKEVTKEETKEEIKYAVNGSAMKGVVRSNLEILSASYPTFIDRVSISYRDVAGNEKENYRESLLGKAVNKGSENSIKHIEDSIRVGFLKKEGNKYFIQPATLIGDKYFRSIEEYRLKKLGAVDPKNCMYKWDYVVFKEFDNIKKEINKWTNRIIDFKEKNKIDQLILDEINNYFKDKCNFNNLLEENEQLEVEELEKRVLEELQNNLNKLNVSVTEELKILLTLYANRLGLKFTIHLMFLEENKVRSKIKKKQDSIFKFKCKNENENSVQEKLKSLINKKYGSGLKELKLEELNNKLGSKVNQEHFFVKVCREILALESDLEKNILCKNYMFLPYQRNVFFTDDLSKIELKPKSQGKKEWKSNGYSYCSTNASTKRRHYIIGKENEKEEKLPISQNLINHYNRSMKTFRPPIDKRTPRNNKDKIVEFYDVFNQNKFQDKVILFYTIEGNEIKSLGRTPYMKVFYKHQLDTILKKEKPDSKNIDYARAIFGYSEADFKYSDGEDRKPEFKNYKGRLRFTPLVFKVKEKPKPVSGFTLLDPKPSACGMYLIQDGNKVKTYNDDNPELNGYKYYKILEKKVKVNGINKSHQSSKMVLEPESIDGINGRVYFSNLSKEELGLLIMSLDANEIVEMDELKEFEETGLDIYESIGGAKPYGYGKVRISIEALEIQKDDSKKEMTLDNWLGFNKVDRNVYKREAVEALGLEHFKNIHLRQYIRSKQEDEAKTNWTNMNKAGYQKNWILDTEVNKKIK